jgi:rod shape-determining protein MreC
MTSARTMTWFISVLLLAVLGLVMSFTGAARPLQSAAQDVVEPLEALVYDATTPLADFVANVGSYGRLRQENRDLQAENERLRAELAVVREDEARGAELSDLLKIGNPLNGDQLTFASVIARDHSALRDVLAINRGTKDGVEAGMPVLGRGGALIGTVERALDGVAWVRLISDSQSRVNVVVQESRAMALAAGSAERTVRLDLLPQTAAVKAGDTVLTSGLGGGYPAGLLVGRIDKVEGGPAETFKRVTIEPAARLGSLETVAVLSSFRPAPVEGLGR